MFQSFLHNNGPAAAGETFSDSRSYPLTNHQEVPRNGLNELASSATKAQQQPTHILNSYSITGSNPLMRASAMGATSGSINPNMSNMNEHIRVSGMGTSKPLDLRESTLTIYNIKIVTLPYSTNDLIITAGYIITSAEKKTA